MTGRANAQRLRALAAATAVSLLVSGIMATPVAAADPTTTTFTITPSTAALNDVVEFKATVAPAPGGYLGGTVTLWKVNPDLSRVGVQTRTITYGGPVYFSPPRELGATTYVAQYMGAAEWGLASSESAPVVMTFTPATSYMEIYGPTTVEQHTPFNLESGVVSIQETGGTITTYRVGSTTPVCTWARSLGDTAVCAVPPTLLAPGTHQFYSVYSGTASVLGTQSNNTLSVVVTADSAHASALTQQYTTFYPVSDTYRDTVKFSGTRSEMLSGTIKIYTPGGTLIKTVTITTDSVPYSFTWNGRNSSGTIYAEGKYKVVLSLKDAYNNLKTSTVYATLSKKKLIWHSTTITKKGSSITASGHSGAGTVYLNTTSGYVRLRAPSSYIDWAGAGWEFTLPSAAAYKGISVKVYAKHAWVAGPATRLGSQNFTTCSYVSGGSWAESCFDTWKDVGNTSGSLAWFSTTTVTSSHRSGTKVRAMVSCPLGTVYVYNARVAFQYATLGY